MYGREHIDLLDCIIYNDNRLNKYQKLRKLSEKLPLLLNLYYSVNKTLPEQLLLDKRVNEFMTRLILNSIEYDIIIKIRSAKKMEEYLQGEIDKNNAVKTIINEILFNTVLKKMTVAEKFNMVKKAKQVDKLIDFLASIHKGDPLKIRLLIIEDMSQYNKKVNYCKQIQKLRLKTPCFSDTIKSYCSDILVKQVKKKHSSRKKRAGYKKRVGKKRKKSKQGY